MKTTDLYISKHITSFICHISSDNIYRQPSRKYEYSTVELALRNLDKRIINLHTYYVWCTLVMDQVYTTYFMICTPYPDAEFWSIPITPEIQTEKDIIMMKK